MRFRFCIVLFALSTLAFSQSVTSLRGRVTDPSHAVVLGAHVTLISTSTGATRAQDTGSDGGYEFPQLQPGKYSLRVNANGFQSVTREGLELLVATPATVDVTLSIASEQQLVEVTSAEP